MHKIEKYVDDLLGFMLRPDTSTLPKLTLWCKEFAKVVDGSKAVSALNENARQVPEKEMREYGKELLAKNGEFKRTEWNSEGLDERTKSLKALVVEALRFHSYLSKNDDRKNTFIETFKGSPL